MTGVRKPCLGHAGDMGLVARARVTLHLLGISGTAFMVPHTLPHPRRYAADERLVQRLSAVHGVEELRALLEALQAEGYLEATARRLQPHVRQLIAEAAASPAGSSGGGAAQPCDGDESSSSDDGGSGSSKHPHEDAEGPVQWRQRQPQPQPRPAASSWAGPVPPFPGITMTKASFWRASLSLPGAGHQVHMLQHRNPAVAAAARDLAVFWKLSIAHAHLLDKPGRREAPALLHSRCGHALRPAWHIILV